MCRATVTRPADAMMHDMTGSTFDSMVRQPGGRDQTGVRIVRLPDRGRTPCIPEGPTTLIADGEVYQANLVKVALNVMTRPGESENVLPEVLRRWFGTDAGRPRTAFRVAFEEREGSWMVAPCRQESGT
jgi:hypothetical protein